MAGFPGNNSSFRPSYLNDDDFLDDDPARYSPPFSDEEYAAQMGYMRRHNVLDEYLDGFDVFADEEEEQQFALSMANTPITEAPPLMPARRATISTSRSGLQPSQTFADLTALGAAMASAHSDSTKAGLPRSRPIAIEMPASRRIRSRDPPSAPLSARGDLPGGYFPDHEDPETRIHRPHPFHADANEARRKSIARANEESGSPQDGKNSENGRQDPTDGPTSAIPIPAVPAVTETPAPGRHGSTNDTELSGAAGSSSKPSAAHSAYSYTIDQSATPSIASYNPTGAEDNVLPMGKYYPTNWENRKRAKRERKEREARLLREQSESRGRSSRSHSPLGPTPPSDNSPIASTSASASALAQASSSASSSASASASVRAENPDVARTRALAAAPPMMGHSRSDSEARRRLQQYQRDMITQATMAASRVLGSQIQQRGSQDVLQSLNTIPALRNLQLSPPPGGRSRSGQAVPSLSVSSSSISSASPASIANGGGLAAVIAAGGPFGMLTKPLSPRLEPLGSPGPVTPIDLSHTAEAAANAGGLLAAARPRMPISMATAPPAAGPRVPSHDRESSFPFDARGN